MKRAMLLVSAAALSTGAVAAEPVGYFPIGQDRVDLANLMIASGFAFAALGRDGLPVYPPYAVAEQGARGGRAGLWQFSDVEHPAVLLGQAARQTGPAR